MGGCIRHTEARSASPLLPVGMNGHGTRASCFPDLRSPTIDQGVCPSIGISPPGTYLLFLEGVLLSMCPLSVFCRLLVLL